MQLFGGLLNLLVIVFGIWHSIVFMIVTALAAIGGLAIFGYDLFLMTVGIREVHQSTTGKSIAAVALYLGGGVLLCCGLYMAILIPVIAMVPGLF